MLFGRMRNLMWVLFPFLHLAWYVICLVNYSLTSIESQLWKYLLRTRKWQWFLFWLRPWQFFVVDANDDLNGNICKENCNDEVDCKILSFWWLWCTNLEEPNSTPRVLKLDHTLVFRFLDVNVLFFGRSLFSHVSSNLPASFPRYSIHSFFKSECALISTRLTIMLSLVMAKGIIYISRTTSQHYEAMRVIVW